VLTKVLEAIPYVLAVPRLGAVAASAGAETRRSAAHPMLASKPRQLRLKLVFALATLGATHWYRVTWEF
jgi:hypothetical protein